MKLTNKQIFEAFSALQEISNEKFSTKLAWKIQTARQSLNPFVEILNKHIDEIRMKHAVRDTDGNLIPAKDENGVDIPNTMQIKQDEIPQANKDMSELMTQTVEVTNVELAIEDFPDTFTISANMIAALTPLLSA